MAIKRHKSDDVIEDIVGGLRVFMASVFVIYIAILFINALPDVNFPIKTSSGWLVSFIGAAFITFVNYVKGENKGYFSK